MDQLTFNGARLAMSVDRHVGERIRQRRTLLGFTQEQLAEALDISYQQIQKYETGANRVSAGRLYQIARRLEVEIGFFFDGFAGSASGESGGNGSSRAAIDLVRHFQQIEDSSVRSAVIGLVKTLSGSQASEVAGAANGYGNGHANGDARDHDERRHAAE